MPRRFSLFRKSGGILVPHRKETADWPVEKMPVPSRVVISMQQHIGAPCVPVVKTGDEVKVGQIIGNSDKTVSAPVHSSVSGKVKEITNIILPNGNRSQAVVIETDGLQTLWEGITPPRVSDRESFVEAVRNSGSVGLGGAGFPTHIKLTPSPGVKIDTLIINAAECEPYITVDYRECLDHPQRIAAGVDLILKYLDIPRAVVATESNKLPGARKLMDCGLDVKVLKSVYPQGAEKLIIYNTLGRKVPAGKLPSDVGVIVLNVNTVSFLAQYMEDGIPLVSKNMTVAGKAIAKACNLNVPIGTAVGDIASYCGGYVSDPYKIIFGGPMMGMALWGDSVCTMKQNNAVLFLTSEEVSTEKEQPCIRCGRCVAACPMSLMPCEFARLYKIGDLEGLRDRSIMNCMECGSCQFSCPSGRKLVQEFRMAKIEVKSLAFDKIRKKG